MSARIIVNEPTRVGSYGTIFYGDGKGKTGRKPLEKNLNKLAVELHHKSIVDAVQPKRPEHFDKYARQVGLLYGIGTDSPVVANALIAEDYAQGKPADEGYVGVRRSALQIALEGEGVSSSPDAKDGKSRRMKGDISRGDRSTKFPTEGSASLSSLERYGDVSPVQRKVPRSNQKAVVWNKRGAQPKTITESLQLSERMEGGPWHVSAERKKNDYTNPMVGAPAGEIGNSITTTPKSWPKSVEYTKSVSRPHPGADEGNRRGVLEKACSKSRVGSMKAFNRTHSNSIYDSNSGFIAAEGTKKKWRKGKSTAQNGAPTHGSPLHRSGLDEQSVLSHLTFDNSMALGDGLDDHATGGSPDGGRVVNYPPLHGLSGPLPSGAGVSEDREHRERGEKGVSFDNDLLYESKEKQLKALLAEEQEGNLLHQHQYQQQQQQQQQGQAQQRDEERDQEKEFGFEDDSMPSKLDSAALLGDIEVGDIFTPTDGMILNQTVVGRTSTAGERDLPQEETSRAKDTKQRQHQQPLDDTQSALTSIGSESTRRRLQTGQHWRDEDNDDAASTHSISTNNSDKMRSTKRMPRSSYPGPAPPKLSRNSSIGSGSSSVDGSSIGQSSVGGSTSSTSSRTLNLERTSTQTYNHDRVYAITDTDAAALVIPGSTERRGGMSLADGASEQHMGGTWVDAMGGSSSAIRTHNKSSHAPSGQVVGYEYRREKFDLQGIPLPGSANVSIVSNTDEDSASASAQVSIADSLPSYQHGHGSYANDFISEVDDKSFSSEDLMCGKLRKADKNSAMARENVREVKRGLSQAVKTMASHSKMLLAGPGGVTHDKDSGDKAARALNRLAGSDAGVHADLDDGTIATDTLQLSAENNLLHGLPEDIQSPQARHGKGEEMGSPSESDTVSILKHEQFKLMSDVPREKGGEHAAVHVYHDGFSAKARGDAPRGTGPSRGTTTGRFKLNFSEPGGAADTYNGPQVMQLQELQREEHDKHHHIREKLTWNATKPEHERWSHLAGRAVIEKGGKPDYEKVQRLMSERIAEKARIKAEQKQERKKKRMEEAEERWRLRLEEKKKMKLLAKAEKEKQRLLFGGSDGNDDGEGKLTKTQSANYDDSDSEVSWSDFEEVVTSEDDGDNDVEDEEIQKYKAELSVLPHDNRFDKDGELIVTNKMTVTSLIGPGPEGQGSPGERARNKQNLRERRERGRGKNAKKGSEVTFYNPENSRTYATQLNDHLNVPTEQISTNPFRPSHRDVARRSAQTTFSDATGGSVAELREKEKKLELKGPLEYRAEVTHRAMGNLGVILKPVKTMSRGVPSREEIQTALSRAARKNLLAYDTRIVETGALLKALNHHNHATPGIPAIVQLNKAFIEAAAINPNPWLLKRDQVAFVLKSQLPWLDGGVLRRLLSAYDVDGSGLIKYVKLTVSLICASRPAMANLIVLLSRIEEERQEKKRKQEDEERAWDLQQAAADSAKVNAVRRYKHSSTDSHSHIHDAGTEALPSGLPRHPEASISSTTTSYKGDFGSEKYLLQLLHGLYEDCEGMNHSSGILRNNDHLHPPRPLAAAGCGIRLESILEIVNACACSIEDELVMDKVMQPVLQAAYLEGRKRDSVLSAFDEEQRLLEEQRRNEQIMKERELNMQRLRESKGGGDPHAEDMSSNFTARSGFTPQQSSALHVSGTPNGVKGGLDTPSQHYLYNSGTKRAVGGSKYGDGYQKRWPEHSRNGSTSLLRDPQDRFSGTGMYSQSAKQVTRFMKNSKASDAENVRWLREREKDSFLRKAAYMHEQSKSGKRGMVRGGDSIAWDDDMSLAASSLASAGAITAAAGGGGDPGSPSGPANRESNSTVDDQGRLSNGRLAAAKLLKYDTIKGSMHVPRVDQATFVKCMVDNPQAMECFVRQVEKWRSALSPYFKQGTISFQESVSDEVSYGTRLPVNKRTSK